MRAGYSPNSLRGEAAVDGDRLAGDERRLRRAQPQHGVGEPLAA
jgi:hypothetical protein